MINSTTTEPHKSGAQESEENNMNEIINALEAKGIILKDSKEGTSWDFKSLYNG